METSDRQFKKSMKPSFHWKCKQYIVVKTINEHNNIVCKGAIMNNIMIKYLPALNVQTKHYVL